MASSPPKAEVCNTTRFEELYKGSLNPATENLALASLFLLRLFRQHEIPLDYLEGWAVHLRGGQRMTRNVGIAVATSMSRLKTVLLGERRVCFPENPRQTCIHIFVHTGMPWDQGSATPSTVGVDVIIQGNLGTPANLTDGITKIVPVPAGTHSQQAAVLKILYQFKAKLQAYADRRSNTDRDFEDLQFLLFTNIGTIALTSFQFDLEQRRTFFQDLLVYYPNYKDTLLVALYLT
ncbi:uncharacterized protein BBA_02784 [Beauveria bassiana ARSEF 2860]|uniref:Uncharacterized protein n=1 Tax=Beauveria bassiana (strain ARSEF 2860) TaxID=655819 RepID=J5JSK1_BEAB2|nr:uncharacterized protein BBA_02784 [Beauveria bassiana ARSEF 2860]EJP67888.1 hypothetical protein BBA_02784 [Beauveria bassiana ARSEF 2860]